MADGSDCHVPAAASLAAASRGDPAPPSSLITGWEQGLHELCRDASGGACNGPLPWVRGDATGGAHQAGDLRGRRIWHPDDGTPDGHEFHT